MRHSEDAQSRLISAISGISHALTRARWSGLSKVGPSSGALISTVSQSEESLVLVIAQEVIVRWNRNTVKRATHAITARYNVLPKLLVLAQTVKRRDAYVCSAQGKRWEDQGKPARGKSETDLTRNRRVRLRRRPPGDNKEQTSRAGPYSSSSNHNKSNHNSSNTNNTINTTS